MAFSIWRVALGGALRTLSPWHLAHWVYQKGWGKKNGSMSLRGGLKAGLDWATPFCRRLRPLVLTVLS